MFKEEQTRLELNLVQAIYKIEDLLGLLQDDDLFNEEIYKKEVIKSTKKFLKTIEQHGNK